MELTGKGDAGSCLMRARVVRVELDSSGSYRVGCAFLQRLTDFELLALL
jgi:hypothetical protein